MKKFILKLIPINIGFLGYALIISQTIILSLVYSDYQSFFHERSSFFRVSFSLLYAFLNLLLLYHIINLWAQNKPVLRSAFNILLLLLHVCTSVYLIHSNGFVDFFILISELDTFLIGDTKAVFNYLFDQAHPIVLILLILSVIALFYIDVKFNILSRYKYPQPLYHKRIFITVFYLILLLNPLPYKDPISSFFIRSLITIYQKIISLLQVHFLKMSILS